MIYYILAVSLGVFLIIQAGVNSELSRLLSSNAWAATISFGVGFLVLLVYSLLTPSPNSLKKIMTVPPYILIGGVLGAVYVLSIIVLFAKIGAVNMVIFILLGQMVCSLVIDHYGWFSVAQSPINWQKITALLLMVLAVFWFQKSRI